MERAVHHPRRLRARRFTAVRWLGRGLSTNLRGSGEAEDGIGGAGLGTENGRALFSSCVTSVPERLGSVLPVLGGVHRGTSLACRVTKRHRAGGVRSLLLALSAGEAGWNELINGAPMIAFR